MDSWLKGLVAAACVVVIAGGAYYAKSEYDRSVEREAAEKRAIGVYCRQMVRDLANNVTKDYKGGHIAMCVNDGHVTQDDFKSAGAESYLAQVRSLLK